MTIYFLLVIYIIVVYIITFWNGNNSNLKKKIFLILAFIPLILVMGFRDRSVGVDTEAYCDLFRLYSRMDFKTLIFTGGGDGSTDYIYLIYNKILFFICDNANILIFFNALIVCLLAMTFIYKNCNKHIFISTILFLIMCHYMYYFNATRQGIAILIMANALMYLKSKNLKKYIILLLIATLIHTTAIIYIIFIPFFFVKLNKKNMIIFIAISTIIFVSWDMLLPIFSKYSMHYANYIDSEVISQVGGTRKVLYTFIYFIFGIMLMFNNNIQDSIEDEERKILLLCNYLLVLSGVLYIKNWIFVRIEDYFAIYDILFIPFVTNRLKINQLLNFIVIIIMLVGMYARLSSGYAGVVPYQTWL